MGNTEDALESENVLTKQQRIAELARKNPKMVFTSLNHYLDFEWLKEAYARTRKDGATGVDGQTAKEYAENLDTNLTSLLERMKSGAYKAPPVRRVHIPKGDGSTRPLGIPTFEDKIAQRAIAMLLESIYEQDFLGCSYGFRPGRSAHQALQALRNGILDLRAMWIIDVDVRKFFDSLEHSHLRQILDQRVRDGVIRRLIDKWLSAGVTEEGRFFRVEDGTPQGGVISPILANIFLHFVLDRWFETEVKPRMQGPSFMVRYADDLIMGFRNEMDARRVFRVLGKRLERFELRLHPEKTRLVDFRHSPVWAANPRARCKPVRQPQAFNFLGFTHCWMATRRHRWTVCQITAKDRYARSLKGISQWCRWHRHDPILEQHLALSRKLRGHFAYYGITGNSRKIQKFARRVTHIWKKWLCRRSRKSYISWDKFDDFLVNHPMPKPKLVHVYVYTPDHAANL
jgi:RNA-directed DNA polymerase